MFKMPASDYLYWRKWGQELLEQEKRCKWEEYKAEQAALDALLYQCPNQQWKEKILEGTMDFQECIDWGMTKLTAKEEGKQIGGKIQPDTSTLPVDKLATDGKTNGEDHPSHRGVRHGTHKQKGQEGEDHGLHCGR